MNGMYHAPHYYVYPYNPGTYRAMPKPNQCDKSMHGGQAIPVYTNAHLVAPPPLLVSDGIENRQSTSTTKNQADMPDQLDVISEVNSHLSSIVKPEMVFDSAMQLKNLINTYGEQKGFKVSIQTSTIRCCLSALPKRTIQKRERMRARNPNAKPRKRISPRCGCNFHVKYADASRMMNKKGAIRVTGVDFKHSNGCCPSKKSLVKVNKSTGHYMSSTNWDPVVRLFMSGKPVEACLLRATIKLVVPDELDVDNVMLQNVRSKVKRMLKKGYVPESAPIRNENVDE